MSVTIIIFSHQIAAHQSSLKDGYIATSDTWNKSSSMHALHSSVAHTARS